MLLPMCKIEYIDRATGKIEQEKIYGEFWIDFFYGRHPLAWLSALFLLPLARLSVFSALYGQFQKSRFSRRKIAPFIDKYQIDASEFLDLPDSFGSFNDFFIRKLKPEVRPIISGKNIAVLPADARYLFYSNLNASDQFLIKGRNFDLKKLLKDTRLAEQYAEGTMVMARLCPVDYHRFHFPCSGIPSAAKQIDGHLYSVNLLALKQRLEILTENKRMVTELKTEAFGTVLMIEVGATNVGSIEQTYVPGQFVKKGQEKGFFAFGGSCLILLFEKGRLEIDADLLEATMRGLEVKGRFGERLGVEKK
jgi:phosphatidylserine decarboxylase